MVEKFRGILPAHSIWYRLTRDEALAFLSCHKDKAALLPANLADLDSIDIQALSGKTEDIEKLLQEAGLPIVTLFD